MNETIATEKTSYGLWACPYCGDGLWHDYHACDEAAQQFKVVRIPAPNHKEGTK